MTTKSSHSPQSDLSWVSAIAAGAKSRSNEEIDQLAELLNNYIRTTFDDIGPTQIGRWNHIAQTATDSSMLATLSLRLLPDLFFHFGEKLASIPAEKMDVECHRAIWNYLNFFRQSDFLKNIYGENRWDVLILKLIRASNFTLPRLFKQRLEEYGRKTLFNVIGPATVTKHNWQDMNTRIQSYKKAIFATINRKNIPLPKVAFLMENSLEMAALDLACLTGGITNVMIAANSVSQHIAYILNQTGAELLFVSTDKQLAKVKAIRKEIPGLRTAVLIHGSSIEDWVITFESFLEKTAECDKDALRAAQENVNVDSLATVMYTSGTTGDPKGIMFSHQNLVYKRFCRAMALPEISDKDRFLAYLPLFHTFGRFLEMLGSVFWGAEYAFMENPALETMLDNMARIHPTVFISIPKKWYQLYDFVTARVDLEFDPPEKIQEALKNTTGGHLRWGLSAAGFLEPDVFRFFQRNGVELMSGFGMTEATGGITMTPPGAYRENSLGKALPGIEIALGDDGEMLIRGGYVTVGYFSGDDQERSDPQDWLHTGDIMVEDKGFFTIIDRKKEIYKNIKGETIAPQKIENFFRDFEWVHQVFLVGDHMQFNTVLIHPNADDDAYRRLPDAKKHDYFSSVVVTVNKFLAPFERILDFRLTDRPFSEQKGELTPKGTYKRRIIEQNFKPLIAEMYRKNYISLSVSGTEIRIPNWFLREKGCLTGDISVDSTGMTLANSKSKLKIKFLDKGQVKIGDYIFISTRDFIDFQVLLANPLYWLGNANLLEFSGEAIYQWYRIDTTVSFFKFIRIDVQGDIPKAISEKFIRIGDGGEYSLEGLHLTVQHLRATDIELVNRAINYLRFVLKERDQALFELALEITDRPFIAGTLETRRQLFISCIPYVKGVLFEKRLRKFLDADTDFIDEQVIRAILKYGRSDENILAVHRILKESVKALPEPKDPRGTVVPSLLNLLAEYGIKHPTRYKMIRQIIVRYQLFEDQNPKLAFTARQSRIKMLKGFRQWLGENQPIAVDVETGEEYQWGDVITFDESIPEDDRCDLLTAISETSLIREAIFLLSNGSMVRLYDIPAGGIWISIVNQDDDLHTYRMAVQTRYQGSYDIMLCINRRIPAKMLRNEINWLIHIGRARAGVSLVDQFGGYWSEYHIWSKEYNSDMSCERFISRSLRRKRENNEKRIYHLWSFFTWSAAWAHLQFWKRTNFNYSLKNKSADNIVIPSHDYQTGIRLISISHRIETTSLYKLLIDFQKEFVQDMEQKFELLQQGEMWFYIFSAVINALDEERGVAELRRMAAGLKAHDTAKKELDAFLEEYDRHGHLPKRLFFAIRRFERWKILNDKASLSAQARTLNEFYETYRLGELEKKYPETRTNFFLHTVFADSSDALKQALYEIVRKHHSKKYTAEEMVVFISDLLQEFDLSEKEHFFLTRLSYPHLKPTDMAEFVNLQSDGRALADVVVRIEDYDGNWYMVRQPISPKEISRLHQIFMETQLPVSFKPEHRFMVAVSERGNIIGGLFYSYIDVKTVYMEKIVVSNRFRRKGISEGIMNEFFSRMRSEHVETVTTAFLRPEYFYRFGFKVERKYSGLVKDLTVDDDERH